MKYDDATWHNGDEFPSNSPDEYGGTHIALFMKWCFINGWAGDIHREQTPEDTQRVINGEMSATDFFFKHCDGKLSDEDLSDEGNEFAEDYYGDAGLYLKDYAKLFKDHMFIAAEAEHDFDQLAAIIKSRFDSKNITTSEQPWWKFW